MKNYLVCLLIAAAAATVPTVALTAATGEQTDNPHILKAEYLMADSIADYDGALEAIAAGLAEQPDSATTSDLHSLKGRVYDLQGMQAEKDTDFDNASRLYAESAREYITAGDYGAAAVATVKEAEIYDRAFKHSLIMPAIERANQLALKSDDERTQFYALRARKKYAAQLNMFHQYLAASAAMDSIAANATDAVVKRDAIADVAESALISGDYRHATELYENFLAELESLPQSTPRDVLITGTLDKLSDISQERGLYDDAIAYSSRNLPMKSAGETKSDIGLALAHQRISTAYASKKDNVRAALHADSVRQIAERQQHPFYASYLYTLAGICYKQIQDYPEALANFDKGIDYPLLAKDLHALSGGVHHLMGNHREALSHYTEFLKGTAESDGENSPRYATALRFLANMKAYVGDNEGGCEDYMKSISLTRTILRERLRLLPSGMRKNLLADLTVSLSEMTPFGLGTGHTSDEFSRQAYEGLLLAKGLLLASDRSTAELVARHGTPADKADYARLLVLRDKLADIEADRSMADSAAVLYRRLLTLDQRLADNCTRYGDIGEFATTTYADIAGALREGEVLVDFTDYLDDKDHRRYAAFVIKPGMEYPLLIPVCTGAALDSLLKANYGVLSAIHDGRAGMELRQLCFDPLREHIDGASTVFIVPSGMLHTISIDALPLDDNSLVADSYRIVRLSSGRNLLKRPVTDSNTLSATLYGGIVYDMDADEMALASITDTDDMAIELATRSPMEHTDSLHYLPYTLTEVNNISEILADVATAVPLTGKRATEASFLALSGRSPSILHIATHGFYFTSEDPQKAKGLMGYTNAMNLSGLVMSGGNAEWRGEQLPSDSFGGLLTAADISRCDLSGTSLVCLSACHTGQGSVTSEGIFGLQRAFKMAGAETLVMTLWEASDVATVLFMDTFYSSLVNNGFDRKEAYEAARNAVRAKYPEPFYWAGFVMVD